MLSLVPVEGTEQIILKEFGTYKESLKRLRTVEIFACLQTTFLDEKLAFLEFINSLEHVMVQEAVWLFRLWPHFFLYIFLLLCLSFLMLVGW